MDGHFNEVGFVFNIPHLANHFKLDTHHPTRTCVAHGGICGLPADPGQTTKAWQTGKGPPSVAFPVLGEATFSRLRTQKS